MSSGTIATPPASGRVRRRWTIEEFDPLVAGGLIREGGRTYLWDGEIIEPIPENQPHINAADNLHRILLGRLPAADWTVNLGHPVELSPNSLPQPDMAVLRGPRSAYRRRRPAPADVVLLVEVSDSTYPDDAGPCLRAYAAAGIAPYWIVNVRARRVEVYHGPSGEGYGGRRDFGLGEAVPLEIAAGPAFDPIAVDDVLRDSLDDAAE